MWLPKDSSGLYPTFDSSVSQMISKALMSENVVGTPSSGEEVPTRPGTISIICLPMSR